MGQWGDGNVEWRSDMDQWHHFRSSIYEQHRHGNDWIEFDHWGASI